jgi:hypothetical protein
MKTEFNYKVSSWQESRTSGEKSNLSSSSFEKFDDALRNARTRKSLPDGASQYDWSTFNSSDVNEQCTLALKLDKKDVDPDYIWRIIIELM